MQHRFEHLRRVVAHYPSTGWSTWGRLPTSATPMWRVSRWLRHLPRPALASLPIHGALSRGGSALDSSRSCSRGGTQEGLTALMWKEWCWIQFVDMKIDYISIYIYWYYWWLCWYPKVSCSFCSYLLPCNEIVGISWDGRNFNIYVTIESSLCLNHEMQ